MGEFDWHNHVEIGEGFTPAQRHVIEKSLTDISHFADGDGVKLITQAQQLNGDHKIIIQPSATETEANLETRNGHKIPEVKLDFEQLATNGVKTSNGVRPLSLTATLTHELYHLADSPEDMNKQAEKTMLAQLNLRENDPQATALIARVQESAANAGIHESQAITTMMIRPHGFGAQLEKEGIEAGKKLAATSPEANVEALKRDGIISDAQPTAGIVKLGYALPRNEEDAARYTHAIMERNFGQAEATPVRYFDAVDTPIPHAVTAPDLPAQPSPTQGFTAPGYSVGDLGQLPPPSIPKNLGISQQRSR